MKNLLLRHRQVIYFAIAGGLSAVLEIGLFRVLSTGIPRRLPQEQDFMGVHYPLSNILSTVCAIIFNYFLSIWFVFERGRHSKKREFVYFMVVSLLTTILSLIFFQIFFKYIFRQSLDLGFYIVNPEILSKIAAIVVVSVLNYAVKKKLIFNG